MIFSILVCLTFAASTDGEVTLGAAQEHIPNLRCYTLERVHTIGFGGTLLGVFPETDPKTLLSRCDRLTGTLHDAESYLRKNDVESYVLQKNLARFQMNN